MDPVLRNVRFGTALMPFYRKNMLAEIPGMSFASLEANPFADYELFPEFRSARNEEMPLKWKYPSVTYVNQCVQPKEALYRWQLAKFQQMGASFKQWNIDLMNTGSQTHKEIENVLKDYLRVGIIEKSDDEIVDAITNGKIKIQESVQAYMRSILPFLRNNLVHHPSMTMEKSVTHNGLFYAGKFDAICSLGDEGLMLVDWKTVNLDSVKAEANVSDLELFDYPAQLAAYIGALNADPAFEELGVITKAAVVLMYETRRPAEIIVFEGAELQKHWSKWLEALNKYWWTMKNFEGDTVQFVYNPHAPKRIFGIRD
uniref:PDDEXK_1 domain-containing protein n=1 Tax=Steinernema glaseri TaxID=37863 RepID=A0A1I7ZP53_9BILA